MGRAWCRLIIGGGLGVKFETASQRAYLGTGAIVVKSESDIKQVEIASDVKGYPYILFFNPNCETCQDTIPELLKGLDKDIYKKNITFVDTTQEYGKKLASKNGVETVPSYLYNDGYGEPVKLAYTLTRELNS